MSPPYEGSCLCGAIRLDIQNKPKTVLSCFCEHCSKGAGGPNQLIAKFAANDVQVSYEADSLSKYSLKDTTSGSPKEKAFCRICGCTVWTVPASAKGSFYLVRVTLLKGWTEFLPYNEIFVKNRPSWIKSTEGIPQWEEARK